MLHNDFYSCDELDQRTLDVLCLLASQGVIFGDDFIMSSETSFTTFTPNQFVDEVVGVGADDAENFWDMYCSTISSYPRCAEIDSEIEPVTREDIIAHWNDGEIIIAVYDMLDGVA